MLKTKTMKQLFTFLILFLFLNNITNAQCPPYPAATGCAFAVPDCEGIDGYCSTLLEQQTITEIFPDCGGIAVLNNDDWLAFYAGTETISIKITPSNCQTIGASIGIQAGIFSDCDINGGVNNDGMAFNSLDVQCECTIDPFTLTSDSFIIGHEYLIVIDGCGGDICDYEIEVIEGSTLAVEITEQTGEVQGDTSFCQGDFATFTIDSIENATNYNWITDTTAAIIQGQGSPQIEVEILAQGNIEICVSPNNSCFEGEESCLTVSSMGEIQTMAFVETLCEGDSIIFEGTYFSESGEYSTIYAGEDGCDSILTLNLTVFDSYDIYIDTTICAENSYQLGDSLLTESGFYEYMFLSSYGCDSTINLTLDVIECPPYTIGPGCGFVIPSCEGIDGFSNTLGIQDQLTEEMPGL